MSELFIKNLNTQKNNQENSKDLSDLHALNLQSLQEKIGYTFHHRKLLQQALTHRSFSAEHNERLEFMGDAILGFIITQYLYTHVDQAEGVLSRVRSHLVREEILANIAKRLDIGLYLQLGSGELRTAGHKKPSILADAFEAIVAAIYLDVCSHHAIDEAIQVTNAVVLKLFEPELSTLNQESKQSKQNIQKNQPFHSVVDIHIKDAKTQLQEYLQAKRLNVPKYKMIAQEGESHQQHFTMSCEIEQLNLSTQGQGMSKKIAEQMAAGLMLEKLGCKK